MSLLVATLIIDAILVATLVVILIMICCKKAKTEEEIYILPK